MAPPTSRHIRQKKLSKATGQPILREDQVDEYESLVTQPTIDTGVEKSEEKEFHLQAALASSSTGDKEGEIPAPPAEESPNFDYNSLYSLRFDKPSTYIRFSQTVEDCTGCQYDMTTEDDVFLKAFNLSKTAGAKLSEDDFETIFQFFEQVAEELTPEAAVSNTVLEWEAIATFFDQFPYRKSDLRNPRSIAAAQDVHAFWKKRRIENDHKSLQPKLKQEVSQDQPSDSDPYVCFRRRETRATRKTRARDVQGSDRLRKLRRELEQSRDLVRTMVLREQAKREHVKIDKEIFETRYEFKKIKQKTGIKNDDDEILLINQRPQKRKTVDYGNYPRQAPGTQLRLPGRSDGRALDADLILLSDLLAQKENMLQAEIQEKSKQHEVWNSGFEDLTKEPLSPVTSGFQTGFRPATAQYQLMTPPSSVNSDSLDHPSPVQEKFDFSFRQSSPPEEDEPRSQPAYRQRIGRNNRRWIDRRGLPTAARSRDDFVQDRWKFDQDDDEEQPCYEMDPYDTRALKFRASIPFPQHLIPQRVRQEIVQQARVNGPSPTNSRIIAAASQPAPT